MSTNIDKLIEEKDVFDKVFLLYGEEKYLKNTYINRIKKCFGELMKGLNYIVLDDTSIHNLIQEATTPAFGYENKLIVVNNSKLFKINRKKSSSESTENEEEEQEVQSSSNSYENDIIEFLASNNIANTTIIFNETDVAKNKKIYKTLDKVGHIKEFKILKDKEIIPYIIDITGKYGVNISKDVASYFIQICSNNMEDVINELRKLIEYTGKGNSIQKEYVDLITTKSLDAVIFDLTDNLGKRNITYCIDTLNELLMQKEPLQKIYIMIYRHYKSLYLIKYAIEHGYDNINEVLKLHPFVFLKAKDQVKNYTLLELKNVYKMLMKLDIDNKSGNIDLYTGIINVMCTIK